MNPIVGAAVAQGAGSVLSSVLPATLNYIAQDKANKMNMKLAEYSFEQQRKMIQEQNEYNSPASQMARYQEAGLNPNLIYGQGTPGNQTEIAKSQAPDIKAKRLELSPVDFLAIGQAMANIRKTNAETESLSVNNAFTKYLTGFDSDAANSLLGRQYQSTIEDRNSQIEYRRNLVEWNNKLNSLSEKEKSYYIANMMPLQKAIAENDLSLANKQFELAKQKFGHQKAMDIAHLAIQQGQLELGESRLDLDKAGFKWKKYTDTKKHNLDVKRAAFDAKLGTARYNLENEKFAFQRAMAPFKFMSIPMFMRMSKGGVK